MARPEEAAPVEGADPVRESPEHWAAAAVPAEGADQAVPAELLASGEGVV